MTIASVVVEIKRGTGEGVLAGLSRIRQISVFGVTENQIVIVINGPDSETVQRVKKEVQLIENVISVYVPSLSRE